MPSPQNDSFWRFLPCIPRDIPVARYATIALSLARRRRCHWMSLPLFRDGFDEIWKKDSETFTKSFDVSTSGPRLYGWYPFCRWPGPEGIFPPQLPDSPSRLRWLGDLTSGCGRMFESTPEELGLLVSDLSPFLSPLPLCVFVFFLLFGIGKCMVFYLCNRSSITRWSMCHALSRNNFSLPAASPWKAVKKSVLWEVHQLHHRKLPWNPKITQLKRKIICSDLHFFGSSC